MNWLEVLRVETRYLWASLLTCIVIILLHEMDISIFSDIDKSWIWLPGVVGIASFFMLSARAAAAIPERRRRIAEEHAKQERMEQRRAQILRNIDAISAQERRALAFLLAKGERSFVAAAATGTITALESKGLVEMVGHGTLNMMAMPHQVPEFVWEELRRRASEFPPPRDLDRVPWSEW